MADVLQPIRNVLFFFFLSYFLLTGTVEIKRKQKQNQTFMYNFVSAHECKCEHNYTSQPQY